MGRWMLGICSLFPGSVVGRESGSNREAHKGSEEQLGICGRRTTSAFRLYFPHQKSLSPSHMEGEATACLFVAPLYLEVLEVG